MNSLELRNQKLTELRKQKEIGIKKIPLFREIGLKSEASISNSLTPDDNLSTEAQISSIPGSSLLPQSIEPSPTNIPPQDFVPNNTPSLTSSKKQEIDQLQSLILSKQQSILSLQAQKSSLLTENNEIRQSVQGILEKQAAIRQQYTSKRKELENSVNYLIQRINHPELALEVNDPQLNKLNDLRRAVELQKKEVSEKEANCKCLKKVLEDLACENGKLRGAAPSFVPEPPGEDSVPELTYRNLISDVGSTGNLHKRNEENKGINYPSPDPLEGTGHQSTGDTKYVMLEGHYQGAATPPNESNSLDQYDLPYIEESKEPGTPKRDTSNPQDSSGGSTPRRYRDSNPALVHNLLGSFHNQNSEEETDFFNSMTREKRKPDQFSKSLFD